MRFRLFAWPALPASAELHGDPQEYARIAASCERAWHDQNDVRHFVIARPADAPPHLLAAVDESVLRDGVMTAVQSRDATALTLAAAERWLRRTTENAASRGDAGRATFAARLLCHVVDDPRHADAAYHGTARRPGSRCPRGGSVDRATRDQRAALRGAYDAWQEPCRGELAALCEHPDADTSVEALLIDPGNEH